MFAAALVGGTLAGAAIGAMAVPAEADSTLRIKMTGSLGIIDPEMTTAAPTRDMAYLVWDTLFATDADYNVQPQMVGKYTISDDKKTYTLTLRPNLKWSDGSPVTAEDCIASLKRWMKKDSFGQLLDKELDHMEAADASTITLALKEPWGLTLQALGKPGAYVPFMMPKRLADTPADQAIKEYVGSGPYMMKMDEFAPGSKVVYVKNPYYVPRDEPASFLAGGKVAKVDRIERIDFPDDVSAVNALVAGELDYMEGIPPDLLPTVESSGTAEWYIRDHLGKSLQVVLNWTQPPFDNLKIRQAAQMALSMEDIQRSYFGGNDKLFTLCPAAFFCGAPFETDVNSGRIAKQNLDGAKALLKEAGYNNEPVLVIHPTDAQDADAYNTVIVQDLKAAGFNVQDFTTDTATMFSRRANNGPIANGGWNVFSTGWGGIDMMSPITNVFTKGACDKGWFGWACDQELQELSAAYLKAATPQEQKDIAVKLQTRMYDVVSFIPMGQNYIVAGRSKKVEGLIDGPVSTFWNVSKAD
jgi:peptide/nickel transport system substrate-binding protein